MSLAGMDRRERALAYADEASERRGRDCDRRRFVQTAALGSLLMSVLAASSAEAAGQACYFVIAEVVVKPGSADELRSLLVPFAEKSRTEPGCQVYTLLEVHSEPGRFLTFERWTDKAALEVHMTTCACRKSNPGILVMQSAQDWATKNVPGAIDGARDRCIFLQG